jgi:hypothetical protein
VQQRGLQETQLDILGKKPQPFAAGLPGRVVLALGLAAIDQVGVRLPQLRLVPLRLVDALPQVALGLGVPGGRGRSCPG